MQVLSGKFSLSEYGGLINHISPVHIKDGSVLHRLMAKVKPMEMEKEEMTACGSVYNYAGFRPKQNFGGTWFNENTRHFPDFASRIYTFVREGEVDET